MDPRVSTLESDVAVMRANYGAHIALAEARLRFDIVSCKIELDRKFDKVAAEQKLEVQKIAGDMRNWLLATVIGLVAGFGMLFLGIAEVLKS